MPLIKNNFSISFQGGLSTKTDPKQNIPGSFRILENAVFIQIDSLTKRFGFTSYSNKTVDLSEITNHTALTAFRNVDRDELNMYADSQLYSYSNNLDKWTSRGSIYNVPSSNVPIIRNSYEQEGASVATSENIAIYAWEDSRGGVRVTTRDVVDGTQFLSDFEISSTGTNPKITVLFNTFYIFYYEGVNIRYRKMDVLTPTSLTSPITPVTDADGTDRVYDIETIGDRIFVSYNSTAASQNFKLFSIDQTDTKSSVIALNETPDRSIHITTDAASRVIIGIASTTDVKVFSYSFSLSALLTPVTTIESLSDVTHVSIGYKSTDIYHVYYEVSDTDSYNHKIRYAIYDLSGSITQAASDYLLSVGLSAHVFSREASIYIPLIHDSQFQSTYFIGDENGCIVTKISPGLGGDVIAFGKLSKVRDIGNDQYLLVTQGKGRTVTEDGTFFSLLGLNSSRIDFSPSVRIQDSVLGDNLHITGGFLSMYDGSNLVEHNFHLFPENITAGTNSASGGNMSDGIFQYAVVYAWTDNQGNLHRSAPSIPLQVTTSAGGTSQTQEIIIPTLRLTEKTNVVIEVYRTEDQGTVFYKITDTSNPTFNDPTVDSITYTDTKADSAILSGELLYTTGGILENAPGPSAKLITTFKDRIVLAGLEDPNLIAYSKLRSDNQPVEFSDFLTIRVDPSGGPITALGVMDDKLIIFKRFKIFYIAGDGPTNAGTQNTFTDPQEITSDVGCIAANSVVSYPGGLMFKSDKGIYSLTRGLSTNYIGARVEEFNPLTVTSAVLVSNTNQVRFTHSDGVCLVYDYLMNLWSSFTRYEALDSQIINDEYIFLSTIGNVNREVIGQFTDNGLPINMRLETDWISPAGVQNFMRLYRMLLLGEYHSPHKLDFKLAYNFIDAWKFETIIDTSTFINKDAYGDDSPYGGDGETWLAPVDSVGDLPAPGAAGSFIFVKDDNETYESDGLAWVKVENPGPVYGGNGNRYQIQFNPTQQKCQSFKFQIREIQTAPFGEGLTLSAINARIGTKEGLFKLAFDNKFDIGGDIGGSDESI